MLGAISSTLIPDVKTKFADTIDKKKQEGQQALMLSMMQVSDDFYHDDNAAAVPKLFQEN